MPASKINNISRWCSLANTFWFINSLSLYNSQKYIFNDVFVLYISKIPPWRIKLCCNYFITFFSLPQFKEEYTKRYSQKKEKNRRFRFQAARAIKRYCMPYKLMEKTAAAQFNLFCCYYCCCYQEETMNMTFVACLFVCLFSLSLCAYVCALIFKIC